MEWVQGVRDEIRDNLWWEGVRDIRDGFRAVMKGVQGS